MIVCAALVAAIVLTGPSRPAPDLPAAAPPATVGPAVAPPPETPRGVSWFALPVVFWLPETRLGLAAAGGLHFHLDDARRASSIFVLGAYTLKSQGSVDVAADLSLPAGTVVSGRVRLVHFPDVFYGIGPFTPTSARETYTRRWAEGMFAVELPVGTESLRIGPRLDLRAEEIAGVQPGGALATGRVEGANGFTAVGLGGSAAWDTRDLPLFPRRGSFVEIWYLQYPEELGRHREFAVVSVEGRIYHPAGRTVLAAGAYVEQAAGEVPFTLLPKLGSTGYLRGWREGRFRDHLGAAAQVEWRVPIWDRFGAVAFGGMGEVAPELGALRLDALRFGAGVGLRFRLTPEGANVRLDFAESAAGPEVYLLLLEAF